MEVGNGNYKISKKKSLNFFFFAYTNPRCRHDVKINTQKLKQNKKKL